MELNYRPLSVEFNSMLNGSLYHWIITHVLRWCNAMRHHSAKSYIAACAKLHNLSPVSIHQTKTQN